MPWAPTFRPDDGDSNLEIEPPVTLAKDGDNMNRWLLVEHTGTHMDAPALITNALSRAPTIRGASEGAPS